MKNLQKLFVVCAVVFTFGVFDASGQWDDRWHESDNRWHENGRKHHKRQKKDRREDRKRKDEYRHESDYRWQENERESWKQEKEYRKAQRKRDKEYRKQEKEYWKERRKEDKAEWKAERNDDRRYRRQSREHREYTPYIRREVYDDRHDDEVFIDDDRYETNRRRNVRIVPENEDVIYDSNDSEDYNDMTSEYISDTAAGGGAEMNWLEPIIGILGGLFSGSALNGDLFSAIPQFTQDEDVNPSDPNNLYRLAAAAAGYEAL